MTAWTSFANTEPELERRARAILSSTTNCVLGTLRADGSPRLSGIDPWFFDGELLFGSMPGARKAADLVRDPRLSLHCIPWESRRIKDGAVDPGHGDAKVAGMAVPITSRDRQAQIMRAFAAARGFDPTEGGTGGDLFSISLHDVVLVSVDGDELVIDRWSARDGRTTTRRS